VHAEVYSLYVKRIGIDDSVGYVYIVRVDISRMICLNRLWNTFGMALAPRSLFDIKFYKIKQIFTFYF
jgi:hypothetical protein